MVIVPEMIGSIVGVYNGKTYNQVEIKVTAALLLMSFLVFLGAEQSWVSGWVGDSNTICQD